MQLSDAIRKRIKNIIVEKDVNVWYICQNTGLPCSTLTTFLNGKTKLPKIDTVLHVCEAFDITLTEFFDDEVFNDVESD
ncbi:MAG: helix-turn-helix transcriptional regulator [Clostridia bacterium]|nr:helix-turn-helix transcriptional regulator [Clostridia bacterium]